MTWPAPARVAVLCCTAVVISVLGPSGVAGSQQRRVVVIGDSVILGAEAPMVSGFAQRGWEPVFDAAVSRSTVAALDAIAEHRGVLTDSLVISLGANDAGNPTTFARRVQEVLDATADVPNVYWLTIREVRDYYGPANQVLRDAAAARSNVTVIDWHGATAGSTDLTAGDGLHLNGAGASKMTQVVVDAVVDGAAPTPAAPSPPPSSAPVPPPTAPPTTAAAPSTTLAPATTTSSTTTTSTTSTTAPPTDTERAMTDAERVAETSFIDTGFIGWTLGLGLVTAVGLLGLGGAVLGGWAFLGSKESAAETQKT